MEHASGNKSIACLVEWVEQGFSSFFKRDIMFVNITLYLVLVPSKLDALESIHIHLEIIVAN